MAYSAQFKVLVNIQGPLWSGSPGYLSNLISNSPTGKLKYSQTKLFSSSFNVPDYFISLLFAYY